MRNHLLIAGSALLLASPAQAQSVAPPPAALQALAGCWQGSGMVMGKPVTLTLHAAPTALGAMIALDTTSSATADAADRYAAHLVFGWLPAKGGRPAGALTGYWSDSFGGAFAAPGEGEAQDQGFEMRYRFGSDTFVNRWRRTAQGLEWTIVARDAAGKEQAFADYRLSAVPCTQQAPAPRP
jgi:opacity protein-like surface antigen